MKVKLLLHDDCPWDVLAAVAGQCIPVVKLNSKLKIKLFQTRMKTESTSSSRGQPEILPDAHVKKACGGKWRYSCTYVNLGVRWRNVVSFISVTIYYSCTYVNLGVRWRNVVSFISVTIYLRRKRH